MHAVQQLAILISPPEGHGGEHGIMFAPAHGIDADTVNVMARHGRGLVACCVDPHRAWELGLSVMARTNWRRDRPRFLVSVEATACEGTGISAADRALTLRVLGDPATTSADLRAPGHIIPCVASYSDAPLSAAALDMVGTDAIAWCSILNDDGELASISDCIELACRIGVPFRVLGGTTSDRPMAFENAGCDRSKREARRPGAALSPTLLRGDLALSGWL